VISSVPVATTFRTLIRVSSPAVTTISCGSAAR
jgi:hypothetical protein